MNLPRSTYDHLSKSRPDGQKELIARIEAVMEELPGYGYRRVTKELHRRGFRDNHKKVLRVMKQRGSTRRPRRNADPRKGSSTTRIAEPSMPIATTWRSCLQTASGSAWPEKATPMTMRRPRASSRP